VADGVNVDFEIYKIRTRITEEGSTIDAETTPVVGVRDRRTRPPERPPTLWLSAVRSGPYGLLKERAAGVSREVRVWDEQRAEDQVDARSDSVRDRDIDFSADELRVRDRWVEEDGCLGRGHDDFHDESVRPPYASSVGCPSKIRTAET
jgi:hypothetical protein